MTMAVRAACAAAAQACVGARFRPQGRVAETGLDCLGVVVVAYGDRLRGAVPAAYPQRGGSAAAIGEAVARAGLRPIDPVAVGIGDLLMLLTGPGQWHFAVLTAGGFVHADAGLRRVTEVPGMPRWPIAAAWRVDEGD